jgi:hypothetical protein
VTVTPDECAGNADLLAFADDQAIDERSKFRFFNHLWLALAMHTNAV